MKKLSQALALVMLLCTINAFGQQMQDVVLDKPMAIPAYQSHAAIPFTQPALRNGIATPPALVQCFNMDRDIPPLRWDIPFNTTISGYAATVIAMSQLFTQPTGAGTVDSMWVWLWRVPIGKVQFYILRDTVKILGGNGYHIPTYTSWGMLDSSTVTGPVDSMRFTTVLFNGSVLPRNFNLFVRPTTSGGLTNAFSIMTDSRLGETADFSTDAARSSLLFVLSNNNSGTLPLYGTFTWQDTARNPQMYAVAFVTPDEGAAVTPSMDPSGLTLYQNYPNPVRSIHSRTYLKFDIVQAGITTLEVYDAVGRKVATVANEYTAPGSYSKAFDVANLTSGYYSYRITNSGKVLNRSFLILK